MKPGDPLPDGWRWATLGEVCQQERAGIAADDPKYPALPYIGLEHIEPETGRILVSEQAARASGSKSNNFRFSADHVLYGKLRPYLNKVALPEFSGRCSTEIIPLKPVETDRAWLAWLLRHEDTVEYAMMGKTGSRMPRTSMRDFLAMPVALPPLVEQQHIVTELERGFAAAEHARRAAEAQLAALDSMPAALLRNVFDVRPSRSRSRWPHIALGEIADYINGRAFKPSDWHSTGTRIIRIQNLTNPHAEFNLYAGPVADKYWVNDGDLLVAWSASLGVHIWDRGPAILNQHIFKVEEHRHIVDRIYLYHALGAVMASLKEQAHGATMQHITKPRFEATTIPLPPLDEQRAIVTELERQSAAAERACQAAREQLADAEALAGAILRRALAPAAA